MIIRWRGLAKGPSRAVLWLLAWSLPSCGGETAPEPTTLEVSVRTVGVDLDADGYVLRVDGREIRVLGSNDDATITSLTPGRHTVELAGLAGNCSASAPMRSPLVTADRTESVAFEVSCTSTSGVVEVSVATHGADGPSPGYSLLLDGQGARPIDANGTLQLAPVGPGGHVVELGGVATSCAVNGASRSFEVRTGTLARDTVRVAFEVWCNRPVTVIVVSTTGADLDADGYRVELDCTVGDVCPTWYLAVNDTVRTDWIVGGPHVLALEDLAPNCTVPDGATRTLEPTADSVVVDFAVTCEALALLVVTTSTTGPDADADGYRVRTHDGWAPREVDPVPVTGSVTIEGVTPRVLVPVGLEGVSVNCAVTTRNPVEVAVAPGSVTEVTFGVVCGPAGELVVTRVVDSNSDVYTLRLNDEEPRRITDAPGFDGDPAWSPDGSRIAFVSDRHGKREVFVMGADGSDVRRLTSLPAGLTAAEPAWSPDGGRIAYTMLLPEGSAVVVMGADGSDPTTVASGASPAWSPGGTRIALSLEDQIRVVGLDGAPPLTLGAGRNPAWSPDGSRIAYEVWVEEWDWDTWEWGGWYPDGVWTMNADGSTPTRVWAGAWAPAWSPDGLALAFQISDRLVVGASDGSVSGQVGTAVADPDWRRASPAPSITPFRRSP